jgi:hypothetical protein
MNKKVRTKAKDEVAGRCSACGCDIDGPDEGVRVKDRSSDWYKSLLCTECFKELVLDAE